MTRNVPFVMLGFTSHGIMPLLSDGKRDTK
jgi:hypothetical protein